MAKGTSVNRDFDLVRERKRHLQALEEALRSVTDQLKNIPEVRKVILHGSYAKGRRDLFTDLDLIVIMDSSLPFLRRNVELAKRIRAGVALDLLAYTPEEVERMRHGPFLKKALAEGKVLYERSKPA